MPMLTIYFITYYHKKFVEKAIRSIEEQDFEDYEVIIADNASKDGTVEILKAYAARDSRVILHAYPDNLGCNARYDPVLREARGTYILTLSGDDWFAPGIFRAAVEAAEENQADLVHFGCRYNYFDDDGNPVKQELLAVTQKMIAETSEAISVCFPKMMSQCNINGECALLRRVSWMKENNIWMENHWEDGPYVAELLAACRRYVAISVPGYEYRAYLNPMQGVVRNSSSSNYYVRPAYIKTLSYSYATYRGILERTGQSLDALNERYTSSLLWSLGAYLREAVGIRDVYFKGRRMLPQEKLELIYEVLAQPDTQTLFRTESSSIQLLQELGDTVCAVLEDCTMENLRKLSQSGIWLRSLAVSYKRLHRTFSFDFDGLFETFAQAVEEPLNVAGVGKQWLTRLCAVRDRRVKEVPLLSEWMNIQGSLKVPAVYGAGACGQEWMAFLQNAGLSPCFVIDRKKTGEVLGVPIVSPEQFRQNAAADTPVILALYDAQQRQIIQQELQAQGWMQPVAAYTNISFAELQEWFVSGGLLAHFIHMWQVGNKG